MAPNLGEERIVVDLPMSKAPSKRNRAFRA
jgi:hypothetical protein